MHPRSTRLHCPYTVTILRPPRTSRCQYHTEVSIDNISKLYYPSEVQRLAKWTLCKHMLRKKQTLQTFISKAICQKWTYEHHCQNLLIGLYVSQISFSVYKHGSWGLTIHSNNKLRALTYVVTKLLWLEITFSPHPPPKEKERERERERDSFVMFNVQCIIH